MPHKVGLFLMNFVTEILALCFLHKQKCRKSGSLLISFKVSSQDCNNMKMPIVKSIIPTLVQQFTYICGLSLSTDLFPEEMKIAKDIQYTTLVKILLIIIG